MAYETKWLVKIIDVNLVMVVPPKLITLIVIYSDDVLSTIFLSYCCGLALCASLREDRLLAKGGSKGPPPYKNPGIYESRSISLVGTFM